MRSNGKRRSGRLGPAGRAFTLIELLTVIVIMLIVMTIALPAFRHLMGGTGVRAAARMVGSEIRLARQEAITERKRIAVLFPSGSEMTNPANAGYQGFRACVVDDTGAFQNWVENTRWQFVPTGTIIAEVDDDKGTSNPPNDDPSGTTTVSGVPGSTAGVRAIIFKPTGCLVSGQRFATVVEGVVPKNGGTPLIKNASNYIDAFVDQYTGRISFVYPEGS